MDSMSNKFYRSHNFTVMVGPVGTILPTSSVAIVTEADWRGKGLISLTCNLTQSTFEFLHDEGERMLLVGIHDSCNSMIAGDWSPDMVLVLSGVIPRTARVKMDGFDAAEGEILTLQATISYASMRVAHGATILDLIALASE